MGVFSVKRNKINLKDYPYNLDMDNRLRISQLTLFETDILEEIILGSLEMTIDELAGLLDTDSSAILPALYNLEKLKLFQIQDSHIIVDKEKRKYFEFHIRKFSGNFHPDIEYLKALLNKIPIQILPNWYMISRSSDDIFQSILEKYLLTPKIFQRYLEELSFEDETLNAIFKDIYSSDNFTLRAVDIINHYQISHEQLQEYILMLEYNFAGFQTYVKNNDIWEEVITPLYEWQQYLDYIEANTPLPIKDPASIERTHPNDFEYILDLSEIIEDIQSGSFPSDKFPQDYTHSLIERLLQFHLIEETDSGYRIKEKTAEWNSKQLQERATSLYRYSCAEISLNTGSYLNTEIREIEKSLKNVMHIGWMYFDDFIKICMAPIGQNDAVSLVCKGKKWRYNLPKYSPQDTETIKNYIWQNLYFSGLVATGTHLGKACFYITPFGRMNLE